MDRKFFFVLPKFGGAAKLTEFDVIQLVPTPFLYSTTVSTDRHGKSRLAKYQQNSKVYLLLGRINLSPIGSFDTSAIMSYVIMIISDVM